MFKAFKIRIDGMAARPKVWTAKQPDGKFLLSDDPTKGQEYTDSAEAFADRKDLIAKVASANVTVTFDWDS